MRVEERFWAKVDKSDGCWVWTAGISSGGYGSFWLDGKNRRAHRVAYELTVGPVPQGLQLDHLCRNRRCVRPDHLEPVTCGENIRRGDTGKNSGRHNATKTHCPQGHPYEGGNPIVSEGRRRCRECGRIRSRDRQRRIRNTNPDKQ